MIKYEEKTNNELISDLEKLENRYNLLLELYTKGVDESKHVDAELIIAKKDIIFLNEEREKRASELAVIFAEIDFQKKEKEQRASELAVILTELAFQKERAKLVVELEKANEELQQFAYVASHDLQEPLRMVTSYTQLLERRYKDKLDDDARDFISYAVDGANRMQKLINDLLIYSRVTTHSKSYQHVDMSSVLGQVISNLQILMEENTAIITNDDLPVIWAEESQMVQVLQNLMTNAIKFKKKSDYPIIHVSCTRKNNEYEFSVKDNGIGIDQQYQERVFTIFQRLHSTREYPGTGIGLSINKRIVDRHGGRIWFEPNENGGTTFFFTIPDEGIVSSKR
jgi:light-regulated signal transduction histidine kinase (bacteriophytochrome)